jgi:hypothetical protein
MSVAEKVRSIQIEGEFRVCLVCGYDMGFHVSFQPETGGPTRLILICPECGSRFDVGWRVDRLHS